MTDQDGNGTPPRSPTTADTQEPISVAKVRNPEGINSSRPTSEFGLPFRRSTNASLSAFFASNPATNVLSKRASSPIVGFPRRASRPESSLSSAATLTNEVPNEYRSLIARSFAPHVAILPSHDTEELLAQKGLSGGLLSLLRPFGETVQGKVTIRDSSGSSRSCEDYSVHFTRLKDGLESPRITFQDQQPHLQNIATYLDQQFPESSARLRTGGDVEQIEEVISKHLVYTSPESTKGNHDGEAAPEVDLRSPYASPFSIAYLRRLLSGLPMTPHETFSHPVACVLAVSSRSADPIEELRQLSTSTRTGEERLPSWVNADYLRYHVLIHDEEHDDSQRSTSLFEQMKRHFGLHCHLLRLRSSQCVPSDDDCVRLPICEWQSAAEELSEIKAREALDDFDADNSPCIYESDAAAVRALVRELVTQSVIPIMERQCAQWNDQIVSKRRGISGRFLSFSKKWTSPFGGGNRMSAAFGSGSSSPTTSNGSSGSSNPNSNYDAVRGIYLSESPEHLMRKLADYAFMLRDYRLAQSVYEMLRTDYANDKAWKYQAGAIEFTAITSLLTGTPPTKSRLPENAPDPLLENCSFIYSTRCMDNYAALRALSVGAELMQLRVQASGQQIFSSVTSSGHTNVTADDAARCTSRIVEMQLVGRTGYALMCERAAACFAGRTGTGTHSWGSRHRKAAFWNALAAERWLELERDPQAANCMSEVVRLYGIDGVAVASADKLDSRDSSGISLAFEGVQSFVLHLREVLQDRTGADVLIVTAAEMDAPGEEERQATLERMESRDLEAKSSRKSFSFEVAETNSISSKSDRKSSVSFDTPVARPSNETKLDTSFSNVSSNTLGPPPTPVAVADKPDIRKHRRSMSKVALGMVPESASVQDVEDPLGVGSIQVRRPRAASKPKPVAREP